MKLWKKTLTGSKRICPMPYALCLMALCACSSSNRGSIDNATILNWENEMVTTEQFVRDHRACLGIKRSPHEPRSRVSNLLMPNSATQLPEWDGLWVTFQSNEHTDVGQRMLLSVPANTTSQSVGAYRRCMFRKGYLLRAA
ncbi:MAG: hypothetical protein FWG39_01270 [Alphaproteobacteria bacterium]|nr:hypothetical protein [Alphaproteobacteria bacterium]